MPREIAPGPLRTKEADELELLIRRYYPDILRYAAWRLKERHLAEDVTQETFIKAARYLHTLAGAGKMRALLYRIAANLCVDILRKRQAEPVAGDAAHAEGGFADVEADDGFARLLDALPAEQREILTLRFGHDLKLREVAELLGLPLRTAQSRLRAALKALKAKLEQEEVCR